MWEAVSHGCDSKGVYIVTASVAIFAGNVFGQPARADEATLAILPSALLGIHSYQKLTCSGTRGLCTAIAATASSVAAKARFHGTPKPAAEPAALAAAAAAPCTGL